MTTKTKPPRVRRGYYWQRDGVGFDLYKTIYVEENSIRKRKRLYVAHLSKSAFEDLKRQSKKSTFKQAVIHWAAQHDR